MTAPLWMPLYISDYLADTGHLSTVEHGAYLLLIMHYWQNGGLPTEAVQLARIARLSLRQWSSIEPTLSRLFQPGWRHRRIDAEMERAADTMSKRRAAGHAAASARYSKRIPNAEQTHTQLPSPSPSEEPIQERHLGRTTEPDVYSAAHPFGVVAGGRA